MDNKQSTYELTKARLLSAFECLNPSDRCDFLNKCYKTLETDLKYEVLNDFVNDINTSDLLDMDECIVLKLKSANDEFDIDEYDYDYLS